MSILRYDFPGAGDGRLRRGTSFCADFLISLIQFHIRLSRQPGAKDGGVPGAEGVIGERLGWNENRLKARGDAQLIGSNIQRGMVEPRHELVPNAQFDLSLRRAWLPAKLFAQFPPQTFFGGFSRFPPAAEAGEFAGGQPRIIGPFFQQQSPLGVFQDRAGIAGPGCHPDCAARLGGWNSQIHFLGRSQVSPRL